MPRRIIDFTDAYSLWNFISSIGAFVAGVGTLLFMYIPVRRLQGQGSVAGQSTWGPGATTLEWTLSLAAAFPPQFLTPPHIPDEDDHAPALAPGRA